MKSKLLVLGNFSALMGVMFAFSAHAQLPTIDPANISSTVVILKEGITNVMTVKDVLKQASSLNSIIGDAAGTISKLKDATGLDIEDAVSKASDAADRLSKGDDALSEIQSGLDAEKSGYQSALDASDNLSNDTQNSSSAQQADTQDSLDENGNPQKYYDSQGREIVKYEGNNLEDMGLMAEDMEEADEITSDNKEYNDEEEAENTGVTGLREAFGSPEEDAGFSLDDIGSAIDSVSSTVDEASALVGGDASKSAPSSSSAATSSSATASNLAAPTAAATTSTLTPSVALPSIKSPAVVATPSKTSAPTIAPSRNKFSVPQDGLSSSSKRFGVQEVAFAQVAVGTSAIAALCDISEDTYNEDLDAKKACHEKIIKANAVSNQQEAMEANSKCIQMIEKTILTLLPQAVNSKYEAANYSDTLDEQQGIASTSTDVRADIHVIAESSYQVQLLLNMMSLNLSSSLLIDMASQLCGVSSAVLEEDGE